MKRLLFLFLLFFSTQLSAQSNGDMQEVKISFADLESNDGFVMVLVQNKEQKDVAKLVLPVYGKKAQVKLMLPAGEYAVNAFHDKNANNKLDTNFMGVPSEAYGFSNDARGMMGKPDFEETLVDISKNPNITFTLK